MSDSPTMMGVTPTWQTSGVFHALAVLDVPWKGAASAEELDLLYYGNNSGGKPVSPLVVKLLDADGILQDASMSAVANLLYSTCITNWRKQFDTLSLQYNPIENYDMTETLTGEGTDKYGRTNTRTENLTHMRSGSDTVETDSTETQTPNVTNSTADSVYGFNSNAASPAGEQTVKTTGTNARDVLASDKTTYNTTDTDSGTVTLADGGEDSRTESHTLTRHGNIGVTTSQQLAQSERDLWKWYYFYDVVFPDVDRVMTLPIY